MINTKNIKINSLYLVSLLCLAIFIFKNFPGFYCELPEKVSNNKSDYLVIQTQQYDEYPVTHYVNQHNIGEIATMLKMPGNKINDGTKYSIDEEGVYFSEPISAEDKLSLKILINLNTATIEELISLPGIGTKTAKDIMNYRNKNGNFINIADLQNVPGIGLKKYSKIKNLITLE